MKSVGGPHAARGPRVGQHWLNPNKLIQKVFQWNLLLFLCSLA